MAIKGPELTPLTRTPKSQLTVKQPSIKKTETPKKIIYIQQQRPNHNKMVWRVHTLNYQITYPLGE